MELHNLISTAPNVRREIHGESSLTKSGSITASKTWVMVQNFKGMLNLTSLNLLEARCWKANTQKR